MLNVRRVSQRKKAGRMWISQRELRAVKDLYRSIGRAEAQIEVSQAVQREFEEAMARAGVPVAEEEPK
jgi:hypothetical protein